MYKIHCKKLFIEIIKLQWYEFILTVIFYYRTHIFFDMGFNSMYGYAVVYNVVVYALFFCWGSRIKINVM